MLAILLQVSDTIRMGDQRPQPEADRVLVAQLTGEARHRARWRPLTDEEEADALAEIRALAGGRADLPARVAGIFEGTSEGEPDEPLARSAAWLCRMAGADADAIPGWKSGAFASPKKPCKPAARRLIPAGMSRAERHTPVRLLCVGRVRRIGRDQR